MKTKTGKKINSVPMKVVAARSEFEGAQAALESFRNTHLDVLEEYDALVGHYNASVDAFKAAVSDNAEVLGREYGPMRISIPDTLDVEALKEALGDRAEAFIKTKESVDSTAYNSALNAGTIKADVDAKVRKKGSPRITAPKPVGIYAR